MASYGGLDVTKLRQLFEGRDSLDGLNGYGGVAGLAKKLGVDPTKGIGSGDVESRKTAFGENIIPEIPPKTYLQLLIAALQVNRG